MLPVSQHPSSGVLKAVTAASGTGHTVKYKDYDARNHDLKILEKTLTDTH